MKWLKLLLLVSLLGLAGANAKDKPATEAFESSVVGLEITRNLYDYVQPWIKRVDQVQKVGVVIGEREILTTADYMADQTLIRLQKGGRGKWFKGELLWVDYHANIALLTCRETNWWKGLKPARLAEVTPVHGQAQLMRWRNGNMESRNVDINRMIVKRGKLTFLDHMQLEIDSEVNGAGWGEAIVAGNKLVGLATSKEEHGCTVLPSSFIRPVLEAHKKEPFRSLGYFAFVWQRAENPSTLEFLKLAGEPRGVIVVGDHGAAGETPVLKRNDVILQIEGFDIDVQGDYKDPEFGNLSLENLATRRKWAGDDVRLKILRDGKIQDVVYKLPKVDYSVELVPMALYDQEPEYLMIGGLLFQPLSVPFLQSWGADWIRKAPFRLSFASQEKPTSQRPSVIVLSLVLPDPVNMGYQEARYLILESLNGQKIRRLEDLLAAQKLAKNGFHVFEFLEGDSLRRLVLDAAQAETANRRVLQRYGIEKDHVLHGAKEPSKKEIQAAN